MMAENETWKIPDFRPWGRTFELGEQNLPEFAAYNTGSITA